MNAVSLLPPSSSALERAAAAACAFDVDVAVIRDFHDPARCPAALLPWLAWQWHVDGWESAQTEAQQRALIADSWALHQYKGTPWAVSRALAAIGLDDARLIEWFDAQPPAAPGTFQVLFPARPELQDPASWPRIRAIVDAYKNTRSHYQLVVSLTPPHPDDAIPPAQLHDVLGLAGVVVGHLPGGPAQLPTTLHCGVSLSASPLIARWPAGPVQLPASQMHSGLASAGVMVVHLGPPAPDDWRHWAAPTLPDTVLRPGLALSALLIARPGGPIALSSCQLPNGLAASGMLVLHL